MRIFVLLTILFFTTLGFAQNTGSIAGKLIDKEYNDEPLAFGNVLIKGTTTGTTSDFDGLYGFENLSPGTYVLVFSFVGYEPKEITVEVIAGKVTEVNVPMSASAASLDEVVITTTTRKESEAALLLDQKKALEIKQSIGAEELSRKVVSNAAGAVAKISGVSKQEGSSNVYVRGLGDRYQNTTFNGLSLPSNDINKKNIDLDLFASDIIENVSISKAYSTRFYGDFSAGNVDISSKDYKGNGFFDFEVGSSINTNASGKNFVKSEGTSYFGYYNRYDNNPFAIVLSHGIDPVEGYTPVAINFGGSFGKSFNFKNGERLSIYGTGSFNNGFEYRRGVTTDYTNVEKKSFEDSEEYEYTTQTTAMLGLNFKVDSNNSFRFNSLFINSSSDKVGYFGIDGLGRNRDAISNTDKGFYQMNVQFNQNLIYVNQLMGKHNFETLDLDWAVGYNLVNAHEPDRKRISLENYDTVFDNDPSTNPIFYSNVDFDNQRYFQNIDDEELNSALNLAYTPNEALKFNFGYNGRTKERSFDNNRYGYDIIGSQTQVSDPNALNNFFTLDNLQVNPNGNGLYTIKVFRPIPTSADGNQTLGTTNRPGLSENTYQGTLEVYAGYVNAEIKAGDKWLFVPGVRVESFTQDISYDVINQGNEGVGSRAFSDVVYLPSLNIKYSLTEDQNLRFSASQTISLPEFKEVAPFVYEGVSQRIGGNPDVLGYSEILNLDLKYEWFMSKSEIVSAAVFYKQINDPINQVVAFDATGTQRFFRTGNQAQVIGFEAEVRKNIIMNSAEDNDTAKLSVGLNATYIHTEQDLYESIDGSLFDVSFRNDSEELQGASPFIVNADINYSPTFGNYKPAANLIFSYFSDRIDALGSGQLGNVIEKGLPNLDFVLQNKISEKFEINFAARNLLNPTVQYFREGTSVGDVLVTSPNGKDVTNYERGIDLSLQLKYKF
ncbi:TonB-dependent receptor domain-containing protein [Psychroserpens mesophilus]|uniref:TonB-dependent receptor n=1 Tax=Psychroserpens mesophilus TaxID=325473 RepID=UPI003D66276B